MIYSMTAFARLEIKQDWGDAVWEIRSVNQRYLETFFRLPEQFRGLENTLREKLRQKLTRGKIECTLRIDNKKTSCHRNPFKQSLCITSDTVITVDQTTSWGRRDSLK